MLRRADPKIAASFYDFRFFYDFESVTKEFGKFGLIECIEISEPIKHMKNEPPLQCLLIKCQKRS